MAEIEGTNNDDTLQGTNGFDTIEALDGNDLVFGRDGGDVIFGGNGNDTLNGEAGGDVLDGGAGNDRLDGGTGFNVLSGGVGNDAYIVGQGTDVITEVSDGGDDIVFASASYTLNENAHIEILRTTSNTSTGSINLTGNALSQIILGNAGDNVLSSGTGARDEMYGRAGDDTYRIFNADDLVFEELNEGNDRVRSSVDYRLQGGQEVELITTNDFNGTNAINLRGNEFGQTIVGNQGENLLADGTGAGDTLIGSGGDDKYRIFSSDSIINEFQLGGSDRIFTSVDYALNAGARVETITTFSFRSTLEIDMSGNEFNQRIVGNQGDNRLSSKEGNDTMNGWAGNDVFVFDTAVVEGQFDRINGYTAEDDQIELDSLVFTGILPGGSLDADAFTLNAGGAALDADDRIIYDADTGFIYYDEDGTGAADSIFFLQVDSNLSITANEFDIV